MITYTNICIEGKLNEEAAGLTAGERASVVPPNRPGFPGRSPVDTSYWGNTGSVGNYTYTPYYYITKNINCIGKSNLHKITTRMEFYNYNPIKNP
jgi:hypothetical protein